MDEQKEQKEMIVDRWDEEWVSKARIAQLFGLTHGRIDQLVKDGIISRRSNKKLSFELTSTVRQYIRYLSEKATGRARTNKEAELKEQKLRAEVALKESQGELHRLRTEIAQGNYISVDEVKADYSRFFIVFKNFTMSIPGKMAGRLSGFVDPVEVREIENELQKEVKHMLDSFVLRAVTERKPPEDVTKPKKRGRPPKNAKK